ncbi:hypothetical protein EYF80_009019 [Liparis tanakae]|uniref:Uncharacterized protein n=1 Tax=Liparis tanakae TaxID=230148 RepID=A0A4Z2ISB9_9TELE|nr:hypothetical protein EYF80_009019 [Liparis tanakae]
MWWLLFSRSKDSSNSSTAWKEQNKHIGAKQPNTHPLLICDNVVAAMLLGQMWCQDIKAPAKLRKHHVVWVSWRQGGSTTETLDTKCIQQLGSSELSSQEAHVQSHQTRVRTLSMRHTGLTSTTHCLCFGQQAVDEVNPGTTHHINESILQTERTGLKYQLLLATPVVKVFLMLVARRRASWELPSKPAMEPDNTVAPLARPMNSPLMFFLLWRRDEVYSSGSVLGGRVVLGMAQPALSVVLHPVSPVAVAQQEELLDEGTFMEQGLQPLLGVVVAELLKRGSSLLLSQPRVLETRRVHDQQGAQRVLTGLQSPE